MRFVVLAVLVAALVGCSGPADQTNDLVVSSSSKCDDASTLAVTTTVTVGVAKEAQRSANYRVVVTPLSGDKPTEDRPGVDKLKGGTDSNLEKVPYSTPIRIVITSGTKSYPVGEFYPTKICNVA